MKTGPRIRLLAAAVLVSRLWPAPTPEENVFVARRDRLRSQIHGRAVLYSGSEEPSGLDKNFYYLTGLAVSGAFLLLGSDSTADKLFLDPMKTPMAPADIIQTSGVFFLFGRDQAGLFLSPNLSLDPDVYFPMVYRPSDPAYLYPSCLAIEQLLGSWPYYRRVNLSASLYALRTVKDDGEIALLAKAAEITRRGLLTGLALLRPGLYEFELQKAIEDSFASLGAARTSFPSIVGSGPNSLILHYEENSRRMEPGEVVVVDVGAEYRHYAGDITRTFPVSGFFTPRQREVYDVVLEMQRRVIAACRPGATLSSLDAVAKAYAVEKGFGSYFNFSGWRHGTCHSLGLDVHDPVSSSVLVPGMVITVEPGLYLPAENLGVRLEDDVLITAGGGVVLTAGIPREAADIEAAMAGRGRDGLKTGASSAIMKGGRKP
jgi:Xaa-Pro aminopeptidase